MEEKVLVTTVIAIVALLLVASISAIGLRRLKFPYTIGLVVVGILIGFLSFHFPPLEPLRSIQLTPHVILYIILPTLVFEEAVNLDSRLLFKNIMPVLVLAVPGLVIATFITGFIMAEFTMLSIGAALLFGALISATDPVAVIALFKEIGAPKRLTMLVDGESVFNDATAIVMFQIIFGIVMTGAAFGVSSVFTSSLSFMGIFLGGMILGGFIGYLMIQVIAFARNDPLVEVAFSTVVAYAAFIAADHFFKVSGVMAVLGAGIVVNWYGSTRFTPEVKQYLKQFWEYAAFVANSLIFLLLGITECHMLREFHHLKGLIVNVFWAVLAIIVARTIVVYGLIPLADKFTNGEKVGYKYQTVIFWGGLRGAVPLALAFSLPETFAYRQILIELTLGVVLFTLLIQGTTISRLIHFFKLDRESLLEKLARLQTAVGMKHRGVKRLDSLASKYYFDDEIIKKFQREYKQELNNAEQALADFRKNSEITPDTIRMSLWIQAFSIEQYMYQKLFDQGVISETVVRELELNATIQLDNLHHGKSPDLKITAIPPEMIIETWFFRIFIRLFSMSQLVRRHHIRRLTLQGEETIAIMVSSSVVESEFKKLKSLCDEDPVFIDECLEFYRKRWKNAQDNLNKIRKSYPDYINPVQTQALHRAVLGAEMDTIDELSQKNEIPEQVAESIHEELENKLLKLKYIKNDQ